MKVSGNVADLTQLVLEPICSYWNVSFLFERDNEMLPVEVLISEHKIILKMIEVLRKQQNKIAESGKVEPAFVSVVVDFFRTYADRFHHGKEEGTLFNALSRRGLSDSEAQIMRDLMLEHAQSRRTVTNLEGLNVRYINGEKQLVKDIASGFSFLVDLYPAHIEKEDKHFFFPSMKYFSTQEQEEMLHAFEEFNRGFTDRRYEQIVEAFEKAT